MNEDKKSSQVEQILFQIVSKIFLSGWWWASPCWWLYHLLLSPPMLIFNGRNATDLIMRSDQPSKFYEGRGREGGREGGRGSACLPAPCRETSFIAEIKVSFGFYFWLEWSIAVQQISFFSLQSKYLVFLSPVLLRWRSSIVTYDVLVFSPQTSPDIVNLSSLSIFLLIMIPPDTDIEMYKLKLC